MIYTEAKQKLEKQIVYVDYIDWARMILIINGKEVNIKVDWED